jgi:hypothetical protein
MSCLVVVDVIHERVRVREVEVRSAVVRDFDAVDEKEMMQPHDYTLAITVNLARLRV